ncbi:MAG: hypothetical protein JNM79_16505 [Burkholderiales bacterium]|nr:hypothetical protein [Burkholderiales bacterium]
MESSNSEALAKYALIQMASEAFLNAIDLPALSGGKDSTRLLALGNVLSIGIGRASRFKAIQAEQFAGDWQTVAHKSNSLRVGFAFAQLASLELSVVDPS